MNKLLILGFGGHARSVADVAIQSGRYVDLRFWEPTARKGETFMGKYPVSADEYLLGPEWAYISGAGSNAARAAQTLPKGFGTVWQVSLIAPSATIGLGASIGVGTFVAQHAHVGPMAQVGRGCIINTGAVVEHECEVGDFAHVSVNAVVAGRAKFGARSFCGAGSVVRDGKTVCADVTLGAGAVATSHIERPGIYVGVPARMRC